jgi:hypothetical protein
MQFLPERSRALIPNRENLAEALFAVVDNVDLRHTRKATEQERLRLLQ